jgi:hypothetical protein
MDSVLKKWAPHELELVRKQIELNDKRICLVRYLNRSYQSVSHAIRRLRQEKMLPDVTEHFLFVLERNNWNRSHTATELNIGLRGVRYRIAKLKKKGYFIPNNPRNYTIKKGETRCANNISKPKRRTHSGTNSLKM